MAEPFRATRRGLEVRLSDPERDLLANLFAQLDQLLDDGTPLGGDPFDELTALSGLAGLGDESAEPQKPPDDPALARLFPEANRDDADAAAEFRRLTQSGLRARKRAGARLAVDILRREGTQTLGDDDTQTLLKAFTDLRLVLGERLGLKTDEDAARVGAQLMLGIEPYEGWQSLAMTYELLQHLQESLVQALMSKRR
jgi:Domain of unknown function (DUF2017)